MSSNEKETSYATGGIVFGTERYPTREVTVPGPVWHALKKQEEIIMSGFPDDNPKTAFGEAKPKLSDTPTIGILQMGMVFTGGAAKYGRFNWRDHAVSSTVYYDAAQRHLMAWFNGEDFDLESGQSHLAHVMACCNIILDAENNGKLNDNRLTTGSAAHE